MFKIYFIDPDSLLMYVRSATGSGFFPNIAGAADNIHLKMRSPNAVQKIGSSGAYSAFAGFMLPAGPGQALLVTCGAGEIPAPPVGHDSHNHQLAQCASFKLQVQAYQSFANN